MIKEEVGKRIKALRVEKGLSQEDLAYKSNLDRTYITYVENARKNVTIETLFKITQALDISLSEFFNMDELSDKEVINKVDIQLSMDDLVAGNVYTNKELSSIFKCSTQGGIRISSKNKTATLISHSFSKVNPYNDSKVEDDGKFIYTGMGLNGDQIVKATNQNGKIAYSNENGYRLYYFITIGNNKYKFIGEVKLDGSHYFLEEKDSEGNLRKVVKFPLKLV
ncbi:MAG: helix-turn-helix domain-containing protein [Acholeplasmatales bacterium]|nr:helix-turn-helix domain-containing protein [Acholeplasmatales bacterium]